MSNVTVVENNQLQASKKAAPKEVPSKVPKEPAVAIYIGPNIPGAKQYTVFNNGLPEVLEERIKEHPVFRSLVVPVEKLAQACKELSREGSALHVIYKKAETQKGVEADGL